MAQDDAIIAKGLNAGLRRLLVKAIVHSAGSERDEARMDRLMTVLTAEIGFTIAAGGPSYWVGEAMGSVDYKDLKKPPEVVATATRMLVKNALHLAELLKRSPYPGYK